jgi:Flp pilus assembly protein TadD/cell division septation protein DedD
MPHLRRLPQQRQCWHRAALATSVVFVASLLLAACLGPGPADVHAPGQGAAALMRVADETRAGGDLATAAGLYRRLHEKSPSDPKPLARLGSTLTQLKSYNEAAQAYRAALELAPNDPDLRRGLAIVLLSLGQPEPAVIQLEKAIARDHDDARLYSTLGVAHDLMSRHDLAQAAYLDGLRLAPKSAGLRNNYALSLALSGDFGAAVSTLSEIAGDVGAPPRYRLNLALIYGLAGDDKKAAAIAHTVLDDASVRNNVAYYTMLRGMGDKARTSAIIGGQVHGYPTDRTVAAAKTEETPPATAENKDAAPGSDAAAPTMADDKEAPPPAPVPADGAAPAPAAASDAPPPDASGPPTKLTRPDAPDAPADATAQPSPSEAAPAPATAGDASTPVAPAPTTASDAPAAPATSAAQQPANPATDNADAAPPATPPVAVIKGGVKAKPSAAATARTGGFVLQFGAFSVEANARKLADQLKKKGHHVSVVAYQDAKGRAMYAVRGGSYANAALAEAAAKRIHEAEQVPTVVVRQHAPGPA